MAAEVTATSPPQGENLRYRFRRTSSSDLEELILAKFEAALSELDRRLTDLEAKGFSKMDETLGAAYQHYEALKAVKDHYSQRGREMKDEGWKRAEAFVQEIEQRYENAWHAGTSFPAKVSSGLKLMEEKLSDLESASASRFDAAVEKIKEIDNTIQETADRAAEKVDEWAKAVKEGASRLLTYEELPMEWRNNEHIVRGYRFYDTKIGCLKSIVGIHNETGSIWTHLIGFIIFASIGLYFYPMSPAFELSTTSDKVVFGVFFLAAAKCLLCSVIWHTFAHHAHVESMQRAACMDYVGISVLIVASILTVEYHGFYCQPWAQAVYMSFTSLLGVVGVIVPWYEFFDKAESRPLRIMFFMSIAASGVLPVVHLSFTRSALATLSFFSPVMKSLLGYLVGVAVYANRWPEKWWPGCFDLVGGSHQIWHLAIIWGIWYHYKATEAFLGNAKEFACSNQHF